MMTNFKDLLKLIHDHNIECILIGGFAAVIHGSSSSTYDIDIVYNPSKENIQKIVKALNPYNVRLRGKNLPSDLPFIFDEDAFKNTHNFTLETDLGYIDLLLDIPGFKSYTELENHSQIYTISEMEFKVLKLEALIKNKEATNRKKDQNLLDQLKELKRLKEKK